MALTENRKIQHKSRGDKLADQTQIKLGGTDMTIKHDNGYGTTYIFEVVEKIPEGFSIWAISGIGNGEYTPICERLYPENKDCYDVNTQTLKAIKLSKEEVEILFQSAMAGDGTLKKARTTLKRVAKTATMQRRQEKARKAFPILERITS